MWRAILYFKIVAPIEGFGARLEGYHKGFGESTMNAQRLCSPRSYIGWGAVKEFILTYLI